MSNNIRISVITVTLNSASTLPDCIASVERQNYKNREHIIVDGASTDGTIDIVSLHIDQISIFKSEKDNGIYDALNKGIQLATGDVVGFLHADDLYASDDVLSKVAKMFDDPATSAVYGDLEYVSKEDTSKVIRRWMSSTFNKGSLAWGWMPPHPTLYVRREWYSRIGGFDINYCISADYHSILKLFDNSDFKALYIPNVLISMRLGGASNKSIRAIIKKSTEDYRALRKCNFNFPVTIRAILWKNLSKLLQFNWFGLHYLLKSKNALDSSKIDF